MRRVRIDTVQLAILPATLLLAGCRAEPAPAGRPGPDPGPLRVAFASDLQGAMPEIAEQFRRATGIEVEAQPGSSGRLAQQIKAGLPVDVFLSADMGFVADLADRGLVRPDSVRPYARGRLVLVVHRASAGVVEALADLAKPAVKKVALANPEIAPYGAAAKQALERSGVWEAVAPKRAQAETVRQAMQFVATGNAEAGLVAHSVTGAADVRVIDVDPALHDPIVQGLGIVADTTRGEAADRFARFLLGDEGQAILKSSGFAPAGSEGR